MFPNADIDSQQTREKNIIFETDTSVYDAQGVCV